MRRCSSKRPTLVFDSNLAGAPRHGDIEALIRSDVWEPVFASRV